MKKYIFDESNGVHVAPGKIGIGYADGGEKKLLEILQLISDKSTFSNQFSQYMTDWPTEYHLSRKRHLIVHPLNIKPGDRILELGCGCGAITRYLLECGADVTAVEGELARASVAAKRCSDFSNVKFIVDDFLELELAEKYDYVLMIGVFEYSQKYGKEKNRQAEYLNIAKKYLLADGELVIAIENKMGLKYINGASEDHNGKLHYGTQDLYEDSDVTTWGKKEISCILSESGFQYQSFSGVFPDYKLPKIIFSENLNKNTDFHAEELMLYSKSLDYTGINKRYFDEPFVASSLRKNGLLIDFANSFLIIAKINSPVERDPNLIADYFSIDRNINYCTHTKFIANKGFKVHKTLLKDNFSKIAEPIFISDVKGSLIKIEHCINLNTEPFHTGELLGYSFAKAIKRGNLGAMNNILQQWIVFLLVNYKFYSHIKLEEISIENINGLNLSDILIDGQSLDCGPQNIMLEKNSTAFDLEWVSSSPIPLSWVLTRNCAHILRESHGSKSSINLTQMVGLSAQLLGITATIEDIQNSLYLEKQFQEIVGYNEPSNMVRLISF